MHKHIVYTLLYHQHQFSNSIEWIIYHWDDVVWYSIYVSLPSLWLIWLKRNKMLDMLLVRERKKNKEGVCLWKFASGLKEALGVALSYWNAFDKSNHGTKKCQMSFHFEYIHNTRASLPEPFIERNIGMHAWQMTHSTHNTHTCMRTSYPYNPSTFDNRSNDKNWDHKYISHVDIFCSSGEAVKGQNEEAKNGMDITMKKARLYKKKNSKVHMFGICVVIEPARTCLYRYRHIETICYHLTYIHRVLPLLWDAWTFELLLINFHSFLMLIPFI